MSSQPTAFYEANCHCRAVRVKFELDAPLEQRVLTDCNCSICTKNGYINVYPQAHLVHIEDERGLLKVYTFPPHDRAHKFCSNCGTSMLIIPNDKIIGDAGKIGINIRSIKGIELEKLKYKRVDGRAREPLYKDS